MFFQEKSVGIRLGANGLFASWDNTFEETNIRLQLAADDWKVPNGSRSCGGCLENSEVLLLIAAGVWKIPECPCRLRRVFGKFQSAPADCDGCSENSKELSLVF